MKNSLIDFLQNWYLDQCNEDWEHEYGIKIDTLDNPGWSVTIDLMDTEYEKKNFLEIDQRLNDKDWIQCKVKNCQFIGTGGPKNLVDIIRVFISWKDSQ